jgi:hypothetical protein
LAESKEIDVKRLRKLAFYGINDEISGLRPVIWRIMLGQWPSDTSKWEEILRSQRDMYEEYKQELIEKPKQQRQTQLSQKKDHPLANNQDSSWKQFYDDKQILEEIEKDVKRTRVELSFFYQALDRDRNTFQDLQRLEMQARTKKSDLTPDDVKYYIESHIDCLARVLFIYAKLNKGIRYVQGMNEVIAVLYYCFWKYGNEAVISTQYLESDLFFCFSNLMAELKDGFMRDMDREDIGIQGKCRRIEQIIKAVSPPIHQKMRSEKIETQYYALRWVMLLMCQDFEMPNCIRLWDTLLADEERFDFLNYVCATVVLSIQDTILTGDFAVILETLQK